MKSVYIETSIISYLAARPSRDLIVAAHQQLTHDWWHIRSEYELVVSELVVTEVSRGDPDVASQRLSLVEDIKRIALSEQTRSFALQMISAKLVPENAVADALHIPGNQRDRFFANMELCSHCQCHNASKDRKLVPNASRHAANYLYSRRTNR